VATARRPVLDLQDHLRARIALIGRRPVAATTARAGVTNLLAAATEHLPKSRTVPAGCMAVLAAVSDEWPAPIACVARKVRLDMLDRLSARLEAAVASGELPA
jgi:hypothetical protein